MQVGDSKQAVVLSIVAIIVVGASVFHVLPKSNKSAQVAQPTASTTSGAAQSNLPQTLLTDPFTHPSLATTSLESDPKEQKSKPAQPETHRSEVRRLPGSNPNLDQYTPLPPFQGSQNIRSANPDENAGIDREPIVSPQVSATLVAVLNVNTPTALISHGDFTQKVKVGEKVGKWTVKQISESGIILSFQGTSRRISVGAPVDL